MFSLLKRRINLFFPLGKSKTFYDEMSEAIEAISKAKHPKPERYRSRYKQNSQAAATDNTEDIVRRRKCCVLLGYSGSNYYGMQRNLEKKTIEEELLVAMLKQKWITEEGFKDTKIMQFKAASRTDRGVSAAMQCISITLPKGILNIEAINNDLPSDIKIFGIKRVTQSFDARVNCDARTYSYTLPTISFANQFEDVSMETYRLPSEKLNQLNGLLKMFEGRKNYHNFTSGKEYFDPSSMRHIYSFACSLPFLDQTTNIEFAVIKVKGQSFMMHQIRKMIGLTVAVIRGLADTETITRSFSSNLIDISRAPGLGLVLGQVHYDRYNRKYGTDGAHETLEWTNEQEEVQNFFEKHIFSTIVKTEMAEKSMVSWLEKLNLHTHEFRTESNLTADEITTNSNVENNEIGNTTTEISKSSAHICTSRQ